MTEMDTTAASATRPRHSVSGFYAIAFGWSWCFWIAAGLVTDRGVVDALVWIGGAGPLLAALVSVSRIPDRPWLQDFWKSIYDHTRIRRNLWLVILTLVPSVTLAGVALDNVLGNDAAFEPFTDAIASPSGILWLTVAGLAFVSLPQEIGWRGFALRRLLERYDRLTSTFVISSALLVWYIPLFFVHGTYQNDLGILEPKGLFFLISIFASGFLYTWLFENTSHSTLACVFLHWSTILPGDLLGPAVRADALRTALYIGIAVILALKWAADTIPRPPRIETLQHLGGRLCVISNGCSGLGREVARSLAVAGGRILLICDSWEAGQSAKEYVTDPMDDVDVDIRVIDPSSLHPFANLSLPNTGDERPYVLVLCGEEIPTTRDVRRHFRLERILLRPLALVENLISRPDTRPERIVVVCHELHRHGTSSVEKLFDDHADVRTLRARAHFARVAWIMELAHRLSPVDTTVDAVYPGRVCEVVNDAASFSHRLSSRLRSIGAQRPDIAAIPILELAIDPIRRRHSGGYYNQLLHPVGPAPESLRGDIGTHVTDVAAQLTGIHPFHPGTTDSDG